MATFRRAVVPGATYFFTVVTHQRLQVLTDSPFYLNRTTQDWHSHRPELKLQAQWTKGATAPWEPG